MLKKIIFFIFIFYILALLQTSFFVHFYIPRIIFNFLLIAIVLINIFSSSSQDKILSVIIGGLCLDIFSLNNFGGFFGFYTLILLIIYFLFKAFSKKYVRFSVF